MRGGPSPAPAPGGASPSPMGASPVPGSGGLLSQIIGGALAQQQQADPQYLLKELENIQRVMAELVPKAMTSVEGVAADLGASLRPLGKVIEKLRKAAQAQQLARPPIGFAAANSSLMGQGGAGMMPAGGVGVGGTVGGGP